MKLQPESVFCGIRASIYKQPGEKRYFKSAIKLVQYQFWWCFWLTLSQINPSPKKHPFATYPRDLNSLVCLCRYLPHLFGSPSYTGAFQHSWLWLQVSAEPRFIQVSNTVHFAVREEDAPITILQQYYPASPSHLSIASSMSKETMDFDAARRGRS